MTHDSLIGRLEQLKVKHAYEDDGRNAGIEACMSLIAAMGDASTRKDEDAVQVHAAQTSPVISSEISVVEWPLILDLMQETFINSYKQEYFKNPQGSHPVAIEAVYHAISRYLRNPEPVSDCPSEISVMVGRKKIRKLMEACGDGDSYSGFSIREQELVEDFLPQIGVKVYVD